MEKEQFRLFIKDLLPVMDEAINIIKKHGLDEIVRVTAGSDGYLNITPYHTVWEAWRTKEGDNVRIKCELSEDL